MLLETLCVGGVMRGGKRCNWIVGCMAFECRGPFSNAVAILFSFHIFLSTTTTLSTSDDINMPVINGVVTVLAAPEGYAVDFDHPQRQGVPQAYYVAGFGTAISLLFFAQRLYVKVCLAGGLLVDDCELSSLCFLFIQFPGSSSIHPLSEWGSCGPPAFGRSNSWKSRPVIGNITYKADMMAFSPAHRILGKLTIPYAVCPNEADLQLAIMITERSLFRQIEHGITQWD